MKELPSFDIHVEPDVRECSVKMNGEDLTHAISAISINHDMKIATAPEVVVVFRASDVQLSGRGATFGQFAGQSMVDMLGQVDVKALEAAAIERSGYSGSPIEATIEILKEQFGAET